MMDSCQLCIIVLAAAHFSPNCLKLTIPRFDILLKSFLCAARRIKLEIERSKKQAYGKQVGVRDFVVPKMVPR
jgi:hypothetical protein